MLAQVSKSVAHNARPTLRTGSQVQQLRAPACVRGSRDESNGKIVFKRQISKTTCQAQSGEPQGLEVSRRGLVSGAALAAGAASLLPGQQANADQILSSNWEKVDLPIEEGIILLDLAFVPDDPLHGFLLGTRQTLLETTDGGKTWVNRTLGAVSEDINYRFNSVSFKGSEGWIVGKPAILFHTTDGGASWERVPLSARLPGTPILISALNGKGGAEMTTDEGAIYVTGDEARTWRAAVEETIDATLNRTVSSGISGASYYTGSLSSVARSKDGSYVGVSSRGNFYMTWEPGQTYWQPHNRTSSRRIQNMGWKEDGGLWLIARGGELFYGKGEGVTEDFEQQRIGSRGFGILSVGYRNMDEVWAAGGSGSLFKSSDGGKSFTREKSLDDVAGNLYIVKFDEYNKGGFVLGNDGILLRYIGK